MRVLELAELPGVDDGLLARVDHDRECRALRLTLRCGNSRTDYYNLVLTYADSELCPEHDAALAIIARSTESSTFKGCDLAFHELDVTEDARIEHRIIFHASKWQHPDAGGSIWFAIRCRALIWRQEPRRTRRLPPSKDRYAGGPRS